VVKRCKSEAIDLDKDPASWNSGAAAEFEKFCEDLIEQTGRKLRGVDKDDGDWFSRATHLLAHFSLDRRAGKLGEQESRRRPGEQESRRVNLPSPM
jgi:hypothetical protein